MVSILLIGKALRGRSYEIVNVENEQHLINEFGNEGTLIDGYRMLRDTLNSNVKVKCLKICGSHGAARLNMLSNNREVIYEAISVSTRESIDNTDVSLIISDRSFTIKHNKKEIEYLYKDFNTIGSLISAVNSDSKAKISPIFIVNNTYENNIDPAFALATCNKKVVMLSKSYSGIDSNKDIVFNYMQRVLDTLVGENIDLIVPIDCYIDNETIPTGYALDNNINMLQVYTDDFEEVFFVGNNGEPVLEENKVYISEKITIAKSDDLSKEILPSGKIREKSFYKLFIDFCKRQSIFGIITKAILGFKPPMKNVEYYKAYSTYLDSLIKEDDSKYKSLISVCIGDLYYDKGAIVDNSYLAYAGVYAGYPKNKNIENAKCSGDICIRTKLDKDICRAFKNDGFILNRYSPLTKRVHFMNTKNKGPGILAYEYVILALSELYKKLVPELSSRIGETLTQDNINSFDTLVDSTINSICEDTCITNYNYSLMTEQDGDTYIMCDLFFPGSISPYKFKVELKGESYE